MGALLVAPASAGPAGRRAPQVPPEAAAISPSGRFVAFLLPVGSSSRIVVKPFDGGRALMQANLGRTAVQRLAWADEQRLLILSGPRVGPARAAVLDVPGRRLTDLPQASVGRPEVRVVQGKPAIYLQVVARPGDRAVSFVAADVAPLAIRVLAAGRASTRGWLAGPDGQAVAEEQYDPESRRWTLRLRGPAGWRDAETAAVPPDDRKLLGLGRDGKAVLYAAREPGGRWSWREARLDGGPATPPLIVEAGAKALADPQDGRVIGYVGATASGPRYVFFNPADDSAWRTVAGVFGGDRVDLASWSRDRRRILARVESVEDGPAYAQVDLNARTAVWLDVEHSPASRAAPPAAAQAPSN